MIRQFLLQNGLILVALSALTVSASAQVQSNVQINPELGITPIVGAPTVNITSATIVPGQGVLVKWSASTPTLTQIVRFDLSLHVTYQNGKLRDGSLNNVAGNLRETIVPVDASTLPVATIKTTLNTVFHTPSTATHTAAFTLGQSPGATPRPSGRVVEATGVTKLATCSAGLDKDCFEVRWITRQPAPSVAGINSFLVKLDVGYANGQHVNGTATASANQTQTVIALPRPVHTGATAATVNMIANITFVGQVSTVK
jgi:hypothetical protein